MNLCLSRYTRESCSKRRRPFRLEVRITLRRLLGRKEVERDFVPMVPSRVGAFPVSVLVVLLELFRTFSCVLDELLNAHYRCSRLNDSRGLFRDFLSWRRQVFLGSSSCCVVGRPRPIASTHKLPFDSRSPASRTSPLKASPVPVRFSGSF